MNRRSFLSMLAAVACAPVAKKHWPLHPLKKRLDYNELRNLGLVSLETGSLQSAMRWMRTDAQALDYVAHWATMKASNARR